MRVEFEATAFAWRGPAPYVFAALPEHALEAVRDIAAVASYGWGCITVTATIRETTWSTSLMPYQGGYVLPLKVAVRKAEQIEVGDLLVIQIVVPM